MNSPDFIHSSVAQIQTKWMPSTDRRLGLSISVSNDEPQRAFRYSFILQRVFSETAGRRGIFSHWRHIYVNLLASSQPGPLLLAHSNIQTIKQVSRANPSKFGRNACPLIYVENKNRDSKTALSSLMFHWLACGTERVNQNNKTRLVAQM